MGRDRSVPFTFIKLCGPMTLIQASRSLVEQPIRQNGQHLFLFRDESHLVIIRFVSGFTGIPEQHTRSAIGIPTPTCADIKTTGAVPQSLTPIGAFSTEHLGKERKRGTVPGYCQRRAESIPCSFRGLQLSVLRFSFLDERLSETTGRQDTSTARPTAHALWGLR